MRGMAALALAVLGTLALASASAVAAPQDGSTPVDPCRSLDQITSQEVAGMISDGYLDLFDACVSGRFAEDLSGLTLENVVFLDDFALSVATDNADIEFLGVQFAGTAVVAISPGTFLECDPCTFSAGATFSASQNNVVIFTESSFEKGAHLIGSWQELIVQDSRFGGDVDFTGIEVEDFELDHDEFAGRSDFTGLQAGAMEVRDTQFTGVAIFDGVSTSSIASFYGTHFHDDVSFVQIAMPWFSTYLMTSDEPIVVRWDDFGPETLANNLKYAFSDQNRPKRVLLEHQLYEQLRFWKRNFEALDQDSDALLVKREMLHFRRDHFTDHGALVFDPGRVWQWGEWHAAKAFNENWDDYGTRPARPLYSVFAVILLFGLLYWRWIPFVDTKAEDAASGTCKERKPPPMLAFALLYSVDTFVPVGFPSGVKQWGWKVDERYRFVEAAEALLGALAGLIVAYQVTAALI